MNKFRSILFLFILFSFSPGITRESYAYIDPGTGSFVIQVIIGVLAGLLVTLKIYWTKVRGFFQSKFSKRKALDK